MTDKTTLPTTQSDLDAWLAPIVAAVIDASDASPVGLDEDEDEGLGAGNARG